MSTESCNTKDDCDTKIDLLSYGKSNQAEQTRQFLQLEKTLIKLIRKGKLPDPNLISLGIDNKNNLKSASASAAATVVVKELVKYGYETTAAVVTGITEVNDNTINVRNSRLDELMLIAATLSLPNAVRYFLDKGADPSYRNYLALNRVLMTFGDIDKTNTNTTTNMASITSGDQLRKQLDVLSALLYDADGEVYGENLLPQQEYIFNLLINQFIHHTARSVIAEIIPNIEQKISAVARESTFAFSREYHLATAEEKAISRTPQTDKATMDIHVHHLEVSRLFFDLQPSCRRGCQNPSLIPNTANISDIVSASENNSNNNTVIINDGNINTITVVDDNGIDNNDDNSASITSTSTDNINDMVPGWEIARRIVNNPALAQLGYATPKDDDKEKDKYHFTTTALKKLVWDQEDRILRIVPDNKHPEYTEIHKALSISMWHNDRYFLKPLSCWNIAALLKTHHVVFKLIDFISNVRDNRNGTSNANNNDDYFDDYLEKLENCVHELKNHFRTSRNLFLVFPPLPKNENGALGIILTLFNLGFARNFSDQLGYSDKFCAIFTSFCRQLATVLRPELPPVLSSMTIAYL